jgi:hypothetical protein
MRCTNPNFISLTLLLLLVSSTSGLYTQAFAETAPDQPLRITPLPNTSTSSEDKAAAPSSDNQNEEVKSSKSVSGEGTKGHAAKTPSELSPHANDATQEDKKSEKEKAPEIAVPTTPTPPSDPNSIDPNANPVNSSVPVAPPKPATPAQEASQQANKAPSKEEKKSNAIDKLAAAGILPENLQNNPQQVITRAQLATIFVKALNHNQQLYELFPFYRDVPRNHPDYAAVEIARETGLLTFPQNHGFYHPDWSIQYSTLYMAMSHALTGPNPTLDEQELLLKPFGGVKAFPSWLAPNIAKMTRLRFFVTSTGQIDTDLHLKEDVTVEGLAPLLTSLMHVIELRSTASDQPDQSENAAILPGGLSLVMTPSTTIFESQLTPGQRVYFSLSEDVSPLAKESRVRATVRDVDNNLHRYTLMVDEVRTPEGVLYKTQASVVMTFPPRRRTPFIVPGQLLEANTEALPVPKEVHHSPMPAINTHKPTALPVNKVPNTGAVSIPKKTSSGSTKPR